MKWLVFGGWALSPYIVSPLFSPTDTYLDVNTIASSLVSGKKLSEKWVDLLGRAVSPHLDDVDGIAGFSMGSIMALALAASLNNKRIVLLSGCAAFCRNTTYPIGWRNSVIDTMRVRLATDRNATLNDFFKQCGLIESIECSYPNEQLDAGLIFLRDASIPQAFHSRQNIVAFHGRHDVIITPKNALHLSSLWGTPLEFFDGGHLFFMNEHTIIRNRIFNT